MDKAVIVGTYEFLGFHFCLHLLEQGIEVTGIHLQTQRKDLFLEEKRLEIGRNSNFVEKSMEDLLLERIPDNTIVFVDYYSYYFKQAENELMSFMNKAFINGCPDRFILFFPIQLSGGEIDKKYPVFQHSVCSSFYLPTVYGPWQPEEYAFQQCLIHPDEPVIVNEREWTEDALFIEDIIDIVMDYSCKRETKSYLLRSTISDQWQRLAHIFLQKPITIPSCDYNHVEKDVFILDVEGTEIEEGSKKQRLHLDRLTKNRY